MAGLEMIKLEPVTFIINVIGLVLGVCWFGWWFLIPGTICATRFEQ